MDEGKRRLEIELARGWMSRYELGQLEVGMVVVTEGVAGKPQRATYGGEFFLEGEMMIVRDERGRDVFCFQARSLQPGEPAVAPPLRGADATELLPFAVTLGAAELSLAELEGVGEGSLIGFGEAWGPAYRAALRVYGETVARGRVLILGERFGFRVEEVVATLPRGGEPRTTGALIKGAGGESGAKVYDFAMPDRFTRRQIEAFARIHEEALAGFALRRGGSPALAMGIVDQMAFGELAAVLRGKCAAFAADSGLGRPAREGRGELPATFYAAAEADPYYLSAAVQDELRDYFAKGAERDPLRPVLFLAAGSMAPFADDGAAQADYFGALRNGWLRFADMRFKRREGGPEAAWGVADGREMIVAVSYKDGAGGELWTVYPMASIEGVLGALER